MKPNITKAGFALIAVCLWANPAHALRPIPEKLPAAPCAVVEEFDGDVQLLDSTRTQVIDTKKGAAIPCGGWASVGQGWVRLNHRDGHAFRLGNDTFLELADVATLYRGFTYAKPGEGVGELKVQTANAMVRMQRGSGIVLFSPTMRETQLLVLDSAATLENRFEPSRFVVAKAGEATSMNFQMLRTVPSSPRAFSVAGMRPLLTQVHLGTDDVAQAIARVQTRAERKLASSLIPEEDTSAAPARSQENLFDFGQEKAPEPKIAKRTIASTEAKPVRKHSPMDNALKQHLTSRLTGGEALGERILFPETRIMKARSVQVNVVDLASDGGRSPASVKTPEERKLDAEKRKLIEELSQVTEE